MYDMSWQVLLEWQKMFSMGLRLLLALLGTSSPHSILVLGVEVGRGAAPALFLGLTLPVPLPTGGAGAGEDTGRVPAGGAQVPALQGQLPQPAPLHPRHPPCAVEKQTAGQVPGKGLAWGQLGFQTGSTISSQAPQGCGCPGLVS